jgi:zinc protease
MERYNKVTKEDVMRVYNNYIKNKYAVILSIYPKGKKDVAKADNYEPPVRNTSAPEGAEYKNLVYNKAKDNFDRNVKPAAGTTPIVKAPDYWAQKFDNGLKLTGAKSDEVPSITIQLNIEAGHRYEPKDQAGVSQLLTSILNESTTKHSAEEIAEKLEKLGSAVNIMNDGQNIVVYISSLTKNIDSTLAIAEEILFHPKFDKTEFERIKKQRLEAIANQATQATIIANNVFAKLMYGNGHIMSIPSLGTKETVTAIKLEDVVKYYKDYFSPSIASAVVVGDIDQTAAISKLGFLKKWEGPKVLKGIEPGLPSIDKTKIYFVNKDKAAQSEIRIGYMALPYDATGVFYKATIMNYALGGSFNSHINMNLRELRGFTYGARSGFSGNQFVGPFTASAGVRTNATDSSVVEFMKEIKHYADNGITPAELTFSKNAIGQSEALKYETAMQKAGFIKRIMDYNLDKTFTTKQSEILNSIKKEEIDALAKKYLPYNNMSILVVGDKSKVFDALMKFGYEIIELDTDGNPLASDDQKTKVTDPKTADKKPEAITPTGRTAVKERKITAADEKK